MQKEQLAFKNHKWAYYPTK